MSVTPALLAGWLGTDRWEPALPLEARPGKKSGARLAVDGEGGLRMFWTIFVVLLILWALGMVSAYTLQGYIHLLLVVAVVVVLIRVIQGRRLF